MVTYFVRVKLLGPKFLKLTEEGNLQIVTIPVKIIYVRIPSTVLVSNLYGSRSKKGGSFKEVV